MQNVYDDLYILKIQVFWGVNIGYRTAESGYQSKEKTASLIIRKLRTDIFSAVCVQEG